MRQARARTRRPGRTEEEAHGREPAHTASRPEAQAQLMPAYARGMGDGVGLPLLGPEAQAATRPGAERERPEGARPKEEPAAEAGPERAVEETSATPVPEVSGVGPGGHAVAHSVTLDGRTDADFSNNTFRTDRVSTTRGEGCEGCGPDDCVHVRGTLISTFTVATQVTLPSVDDFPDLTGCQRRRVSDAIRNVLRPHEQQHVQAFRTYNGTVRQAFDMTICRADFEAAIQNMHDTLQAAREAAAQARSDALDPFNFTVDLDCEDPPPRPARTGRRADAGAVGPGGDEAE